MSQDEPAPRDVYSAYEAGLRQLLDQLGPDHPRYADALTYEQRLTENIDQSRLSGDTETRRSERSEIIRQLNELALDALGISFNDIREQVAPPPPRAGRASKRTSPHLTINRVEAIELFAQLMEPGSEYRMMRLMGDAKMGKSHLMTKVFPKLARETHAAHPAVLDLRNSAQTIPDVLHAAFNLLGGVAEFPGYYAAHQEWLGRPRSESKGFARTAKHAKDKGRSEDRSVEGGRWVHELTDQFVADLSARTDRQVALLFDAVEAAADSTRAWLMDTLLVRLTPLAHLRTVVAGRRLPEASGSYAAVCLSYELPPVREKEAYLAYSRRIGANLTKSQIDALVQAFDHKPGLFADVMPKFMSGEAAYA